MNEQDDDPHVLVAIQVTVVVPALNVLPEDGEQLTVAVGVPVEEGFVQVATAVLH